MTERDDLSLLSDGDDLPTDPPHANDGSDDDADGGQLFDHTPQWLTVDTDGARSLPLFGTTGLQMIERAATAALPPFTLMARAGAAAAAWLQHHEPSGPLLLIAGGGNNGGDALVAATALHHAGRTVEVWLAADPDRFPQDAARAYQEAAEAGVPLHPVFAQPGLPDWPDWCTAAVDGLLGIGLRSGAGAPPLTGPMAQWIAHLNRLAARGARIYALDMPSGLAADTGTADIAVHATRTLAFIALKPGLLTGQGRDHAGALDLATLGVTAAQGGPAGPDAAISSSTEAAGAEPLAWLNTPAGFAGALPTRRHASHKGSFGTLAVIGGSAGMIGAPMLGARAALHLGAGRVHIAFLAEHPPAFDPVQPELMLHPCSTLPLDAMSALVIGPGLGAGEAARAALRACLDSGHPLVLDADALNLLATDAALASAARAAPQPRVLTPHPLEAARLLGTDVRQVQADRLAAARRLAREWQAVVVLKGSGTIVADAGGETLVVNPTGNAGLATAGTGDVLAGMIGSLLAQRVPAAPAARAAVWLHGAAADDLVTAGHGPAGLTASELLPAARQRLNRLA